MGREEDDAEAPTLAQLAPPIEPAVVVAPVSERTSRREIEGLASGVTIGRYQLVARLGAGAMGVVWSAHDPQLDRKIAIKLVHPSLARSPEASSRLLREARAMAKLSHRAVVTVHDAGEVAGQLFLAMELVEGTTLGTMLRARNADAIADWPRWLELMLDAGHGLAAAHRSGVLHRDFKPDNVLVDHDGRVCVGDFGLATLGAESFAAAMTQRWEAGRPFDLTTTGALLGTPAYMGPQQLRGEPVDARADQFSFCIATWEAMYGARPFAVEAQGLDALPEQIERIEQGTLPEPPLDSLVPPPIREILARGLAASPAERWPDMDALLDALAEAGRTVLDALAESRPDHRRAIIRKPHERGARSSPSAGSTPGAAPATLVRANPRSSTPPPSRAWWYVGGAVVLAAVTGAVLAVATRTHGPEAAPGPTAPPPTASAPVPSPTTAPGVTSARRLFGVPMRTSMALSEDGKRIAFGSNRLEVRSLDGKELWTVALPVEGDVNYIELGSTALRFGLGLGQAIARWDFLAGSEVTTELTLPGRWMGRTKRGDLVFRRDLPALTVMEGGSVVASWPTQPWVEVTAISPSGERVAYLETSRFSGTIVVHDLATGARLESARFDAPTALTWLDDHTLAYGTGTLEQPRIYRVEVTATGFGTPVEIYGIDVGWFGQLRAHGTSLFATEMHPSTRVRVIDRSTKQTSVHDLDNATGGAALGWTGPDEYLTWNRDTRRVDRRRGLQIDLTRIALDGEPANATLADDTLIVTLRRPRGREAIALSRTDGTQLWRHGDHLTLAVRCANDEHAPCFAVRSSERGETVVTLDPRTGELGTTALWTGPVEDIAVSADGKRLLVASASRVITEIDPAGKQLATHESPLTTIRSVAYDPTGGILVGGTWSRNNYQVGRVVGDKFHILSQADDDLMSLVRPSRDGRSVLVLARVFSPEVWRLELPAVR